MAGFNFSSGVMVFAVKPARQGERWTSPRIYTDSSVKMWVKPTPDSTNTAGSAIEKDAAGWPRPYMPVCIWHYWCLCVLLFMWGLCSAQTPSSPVNHRKRKKNPPRSAVACHAVHERWCSISTSSRWQKRYGKLSMADIFKLFFFWPTFLDINTVFFWARINRSNTAITCLSSRCLSSCFFFFWIYNHISVIWSLSYLFVGSIFSRYAET